MERSQRIRGMTIIILLSASVAGLTALPYYLLQTRAPGEMTFSGMSTNIPDEASYLMWSRQHAEGHFLVSNQMTTEAHPRVLPNPAWLTVGLLARLTGVPVIVAYHMVRVTFSFIYLLILWFLMLRIMPYRNAARAAWLVIALGGGLGWLALLGMPVPSADWITELWSWSSMLHYPHFALTLALLAAFFLLWIDSRTHPGWVRPAAAGLLISTMTLVHPYTAMTLTAALIIHFLFTVWRIARDNRGRRDVFAMAVRETPGLLPMFACAVPGFAIMGVQAAINPVVAQWAAQNVMPSPPPWEYVLGFAFPGLGALAFAVRGMRRRVRLSEIQVLFLIWILVALLLAYADPVVPFARRCVEGIHIAVVALAMAYLVSFDFNIRLASIILLLATTLPSPIYHITREVRADNPGYVVGDHDRMIDAVKTYVKDDTVLSDARSSLFIVADTDARVYVGHHEMSPDFLDKAKQVHLFMNTPTTWKERRDMLTRTGCRWLLGSPYMMDRLLAGVDGVTVTDFGLKEYARGDSWVLVGPLTGFAAAGNQ